MVLRRRVIAALGATAVGAVLSWPSGAAADTASVPCSPAALAGAFGTADAAGAHELILAPGCHYEIDSMLSLSASGADVSVIGNGATIDGGESVRAFEVESGARLRLENLSVVDGAAPGEGGALYVAGGGAAELERVTLDGNSGTYGGAISLYGDLVITDSAILNSTASSDAGGIEVNSGATLEMSGSLVRGNTATTYGGGIRVMYGGSVEVTNSTFTENGLSGGGNGGALYSYDSTLTLRNVTVTGNDAAFGGGVYAGETTLDIRNSIVAENLPSGGSNRDCYFFGGTPTGSSNLTTSTASACASTGFASIPAGNLGLSPLADNGGPTQTFALGPASGARGAATSDCPAADQRGYPRPGPSGCDIGAYESGSVVTIEDTAAVEGDSGATTLSFPVTLGPPVSEQVSVAYEIDHVSTDGGDFDPEPVDGELVLEPGEISGAIEVEVAGDAAIEPDETFTATLTGVATAAADVALGRSAATGTVINDDQPDYENPGCTGGVGDAAALYQSIAWANANGQDDTIHLGEDCLYDTAGRTALTIGPDGGHSITIDGNGASVDGAGEHVVLIVRPDSDLTLDGVTISDGLNPGTSFDTPGTDGYGGGLTITNADVDVVDSRFDSNVAGGETVDGDLGGSGGAIFIFEGSLDVTRSTFTGNRTGWGGAIGVQASENPVDVNVVDSTFGDNDADFYGGAIETNIGSYWGGSGSVSVLGSTLTGNHADVGGGALDVSDGHLSVVNSTIVGNSAGSPGFSQNGGALLVNTGGDDSGAVLVNTTMLGNTATGSVDGIAGGSRVTVKNSILAGAGSGQFSCPNGNSGMTVTHSLSDDTRCGSTPGFTVRTPTAALALGALADNGGPTETVALRSGSPAIDAGDAAVCDAELPQDGGLPVDQRGWQRGLNPPNPCDIGAYEADRMRIGDASGTEGADAELTFEVTLDAPALTDVSVDYATEDGTAHAGTDYVSTSGTLEIEQGETAGEIVVDLIDNDESGGEREFYVNLTNAEGAAATVARGTGTISEDDFPVLTVELTGSGTGKVTGSDGTIDCGLGGTQCSASATAGEQIELTAQAGPNSVFAGWSGGGCSGTGGCTVTMDQAQTVSASFDLQTHRLTVGKAGNGAGTVTSDPAGIDCGSSCEGDYDHGTSVTLTATPAAGSAFTGWSGACTGAGECVVTMDEARDVTATFDLESHPVQTHRLAVGKAGNGAGTVTSDPAGIDCGSSCEGDYDHGTSVTLTATPAAGSAFTGWSGACAGAGACVVTMDEARNVTATFTEVTPPPPDNNFKIRKFKRNRKKGAGVLPVVLPGPGKVVLVGPRLRKVSRPVDSAGRVALKVKVRPGPALRRLNHRGRLRPRLRVTYTPTGGTPRTKSRRVTLLKRVARG